MWTLFPNSELSRCFSRHGMLVYHTERPSLFTALLRAHAVRLRQLRLVIHCFVNTVKETTTAASCKLLFRILL